MESVEHRDAAPATVSSPSIDIDQELVLAYHQHSADLLRYAASLAHNGDIARDAVQETFTRYFAELRYGRPVHNPRGWLYHVLRNHLFEVLKAAALNPLMDSEALEDVADESHDPERAAWRSEAVRQLSGSLTGRELICLELRAGGMRYTEIAGAMGVRTGTVGALLARVQKKLQRSAQGKAAPKGMRKSWPVDRGADVN